jgi:serine protease Do
MRTRIVSLWLCVVLSCAVQFGNSAQASDARETPLVRAVKRAQASVVNIHSEKTATEKDSIYGGAQAGRKVNGMGTGIIVDERGYIVTNQHVIADVESLRVTLQDGSSFMARVIAFDRKSDLAIIKIEATQPLPVMPLGTSADLMLGESVIAVGNAFGYEHTVTSGILSALSRDVEVNEFQAYKNLLQTDASINPGNSGGPLINLDGDVVGINVAIRAGAQRIGFAIPVDDARKIIARLLNVRKLGNVYHGVISHDVKKRVDRMQLVVDRTESNSPAAAAGFQSGDIIVHAGSITVIDQADFERALIGHPAGEAIPIVVTRNDTRVKLSLELAKENGTKASTVAVSQQVVRGNNPEAEVEDESGWQTLGLRLSKISTTQLGAARSRYRGGMKVTAVRNDSPASRNGIKTGDILVGLHNWETISSENISYILSQPDLGTVDPLKFYVLRGQETLFGYLKLAQK